MGVYMFLRVLQLAIVAFIIVLMVTQVIIPYFRGTIFFPMFSKEIVLQKELEEVKQESVEADMVKEIEGLKKVVKEKLEQISEPLEKKSRKKRV
jgi:hypothetical protein